MGSYLFKWQRPAKEVYVTGTFDDWAKSVKLENKGNGFEKKVNLPPASKNIYYKFVVDGNWTTNDDHPIEADPSGNLNNFLKPEELGAPTLAAGGLAAATMSTVTPHSTTAKLAGDVPKEPSGSKGAPSSDVPGGSPETSGEAKDFSVNPIPASAGAGNPISLKPGEKIPETSKIATNDTTTADTLDKESYEKSGDGSAAALAAKNPIIQSAGAGTSAAALAGLVPKEARRLAQVIPESSTDSAPANPTIQSAGAGTTTAALAAEVPKEPRKEAQVLSNTSKPATDVPEVVQESIADAKTGPEAAANPEAVKEKSAVESELLKDIKPSQAQGEPAPTASAATASTAPEPTAPKAATTTGETLTPPPGKEKSPESRDVSPLSHPKGPPATTGTAGTTGGTSQPTVTTGVASAPTATKTEANASSPVNKTSANATTDKKAKRGSFFGKLKEKFKHKDEK